MRLLVFAVVGLCAMIVAYAFGLGGSVGSVIFLAILTVGVLDRWAQPILERLRP
jgi:hypothetical protein